MVRMINFDSVDPSSDCSQDDITIHASRHAPRMGKYSNSAACVNAAHDIHKRYIPVPGASSTQGSGKRWVIGRNEVPQYAQWNGSLADTRDSNSRHNMNAKRVSHQARFIEPTHRIEIGNGNARQAAFQRQCYKLARSKYALRGA